RTPHRPVSPQQSLPYPTSSTLLPKQHPIMLLYASWNPNQLSLLQLGQRSKKPHAPKRARGRRSLQGPTRGCESPIWTPSQWQFARALSVIQRQAPWFEGPCVDRSSVSDRCRTPSPAFGQSLLVLSLVR